MSESTERTAQHEVGPIEHVGVFAELLGAWYPRDYVVAVMDDLEEAEQTKDALQRAGFPARDVRLFPSEEIVAALRAIDAHRNVFQRVGAALQREVTEEGLANREYNDEARAGRHIITVLAVTEEEIERARQVLVEHGARRIMHYRKYTITDLR